MTPFEIIGHILSGGGAWIVIPILIAVSTRMSRDNRSRHHHNQHLNNPYHPRYNLHQPRQYQPYAPPPTPLPPSNPYGYGPGYPGSPNPPNYPVPGPYYGPNQPQNYGWGPPSAPLPTAPEPAWPDPVIPEGRVIPAAPDSKQMSDPNLPTKDIYVWGRNMIGWVYAGRLTVAKTLTTDEIRRYADGKFGPDLRDKLCIEADNFEQARYIFEQSRTI